MRALKALVYGLVLSCSASTGEWFATEIQALTYPILANQARIEGTVRLKLVLDRNGVISRVDIISGNPVLARAAHDNILKWKFSAPCSGGEPPEHSRGDALRE